MDQGIFKSLWTRWRDVLVKMTNINRVFQYFSLQIVMSWYLSPFTFRFILNDGIFYSNRIYLLGTLKKYTGFWKILIFQAICRFITETTK